MTQAPIPPPAAALATHALPLLVGAWLVLRPALGDGSFVGPSFCKEPPPRVDFANDTGARVDCTAEGDPPPAVSWLLADGKPVEGVPHTRQLLANGSLYFHPFHPSAYRHDVHAATYRCVASNVVGRVLSRDVRVRAVVLQQYEVQVYYNKNIIRGNTAVLKCTIPSFVRDYITVTSWVQNSKFNIYPSSKGDEKFHMLPSGELLVRHVSKADEYHSYQCRALNRLTDTTSLSVGQAHFIVTESLVMTPPRPLDKQMTLSVRREQDGVLPCFVEGNPPPTVRWFRQERHELRAVVDDERVVQVGNCLLVQHVDEADAGRWVCVANNSAGDERLDITLHVTAPLSVALQPAGQVTLDAGTRGELLCLVSGPAELAAVQRLWLKDGVALSKVSGAPATTVDGVAAAAASVAAASGAVDVAAAGDRLVLESVAREDAGMYQCVARTEDDSAQASVQLRLGTAQPQLLYKFINQTLQPGPPVSLKCIASGNPPPQISWDLDGFPLPSNDRFVIGQYLTLHGDVISHVNISTVAVEDGGIYKCTATNQVGSDSHSAEMRVYGLPFVRPIPNVTAVAGERLYVACPVSGYPINTITWEKDGKLLPLNRRQHVFSNGTLLLENVQRAPDAGLYRCVASDRQGHASSQLMPLSVIVPPKIAPFAFQTDLHVGDRAGVQCFVAKGDLPLRFEWRRDGGPPGAGVSVHALGEHVSALSIESLRPEHAGNYSCSAVNAAANATHSSRLLVNVPPRIGPFTFGDLIEGVRTQVQCVVQQGDGPLTLEWLKDGGPLPSELETHVSQDAFSSTLAIPLVGRAHAGNYTCVASNKAKTTRATAPLIVSVPPRWLLEPHDVNVTRGQTAALHCEADGFPAPTLVWRKVIGRQPSQYQVLSGRPRGSLRGLQLFPNGTLQLRPALPEHQGQYLCEASNGIGHGLSAAVSLVVHIPPDFEVKSAQATVRRGGAQTLQCQAQGDAPMTIDWLRDGSRQPAALNPRYEVKETPLAGGLLSELLIVRAEESDSGAFLCVAQNLYGRAERTVHLQVQDAPGRPQEFRVLELGSRSVKLAWLAPLEDRGPVLQYVVQYQQDTQAADEWQSAAAGGDVSAEVRGLQPATLYRFRVLAENALGAGEPSAPLLLRTEGEAPGGAPQQVSVAATAADGLRVAWTPPPPHLWHGDVLGYYVGYRELCVPGRQPGYTFTTVTERGGASAVALLTGLHKFCKYGVVVQAFNEKGSGPMSSEIVGQTQEDVPSAPPVDLKCSAQGSQSIIVSWRAPPPAYQHGVIVGYKLYYENTLEWPPGVIEADTKSTAETSMQLHGLSKYANYSVQAWAYTRVGDGVKTSPIFCLTHEDVPEAPAGVKVVASSPTSLVVSWLPPARVNGRLLAYTLYWRALLGEHELKADKLRLKAPHTHHEARDLRGADTYEYWVTAHTRVGEGHSTAVVRAALSDKVPAAIVSFGRAVAARLQTVLLLACLAVGEPAPRRQWRGPDGMPPADASATLFANGSLLLADLQRRHQGNYSCDVVNPAGFDRIVYAVTVLGPPAAPKLRTASAGASWLQLLWEPVDNGGSAIRYFVLSFQRAGGDGDGEADGAAGGGGGAGEWAELSLPRDATAHRLAGLECGTAYRVRLSAVNAVGGGPASAALVTRTEGARPLRAAAALFLAPNASSVTLHLRHWRDNGCPIAAFSVEYREMAQDDWITVGSHVPRQDNFTLSGLWPDTQYVVRVAATNSAGTTSAQYPVSTLRLAEGTLEPEAPLPGEDSSEMLDVAIVVPGVAVLLLLATATVGACLCLRRGPAAAQSVPLGPRGSADEPTEAGQLHALVALDNKHNLAQREQYYAAVQKGLVAHSVDRIPEFAEDISPYATFHVQSQPAASSPAHVQAFVYHDHRLAAMETMKLKSANPREDYPRLRPSQKSKSLRSDDVDYPCVPVGHRRSEGGGDASALAAARLRAAPLHSAACPAAGPESSTSPEPSPQASRRTPARRHRHNVRSSKAGEAKLILKSQLDNLCKREVFGTSEVHTFRTQRSRSEGRVEVARATPPCPWRKDGEPALARLEPPSAFTDGQELSEAECDMDSLRRRHKAFPLSVSGVGRGAAGGDRGALTARSFTIAV